MNARIKTLVLSLVVFLLLFSAGCGMTPAHADAIAGAIIDYSDYYFEVRNLSAQVREQEKEFESGQLSYEYTILVEIPDYAAYDISAVSFALRQPDFVSGSAENYYAESYDDLLTALEQYAHDHEAPAYYQLRSVFTVTPDGDGWKADFSSRSRREIEKTVQDLVVKILLREETYQQNELLLRIASAIPGLLDETFGGEDYADLITVTDISADAAGTYTVSFSYPDPAFVYAALSDEYAASFNKPFFGSALNASLSVSDIESVDLTDAPLTSASVTISYDSSSEMITLEDDFGLSTKIQAVKAQTEAAVSTVINAAWRVAPQSPPSSGKVLEGENKGNEIVFQTDSEDEGKYYYVRFYLLPGTDPAEEGTLQLGIFVNGAKSAKFSLPSGYYRIGCWIGENWYGLDHLFGDDYEYFDSSNAIRSRYGYSNTISFD